MKDIYCVVTFNTTHHALIFEKLLKENKLNLKLMPVPRQLRSSCGTAAYVDCADKDKIISLCDKENSPIECFHELESSNKESWFLKYLKK